MCTLDFGWEYQQELRYDFLIMKEGINEWMHIWMNGMHLCMYVGMNKWTNERMNKWMNEWTNEIERIKEWMI